MDRFRQMEKGYPGIYIYIIHITHQRRRRVGPNCCLALGGDGDGDDVDAAAVGTSLISILAGTRVSCGLVWGDKGNVESVLK